MFPASVLLRLLSPSLAKFTSGGLPENIWGIYPRPVVQRDPGGLTARAKRRRAPLPELFPSSLAALNLAASAIDNVSREKVLQRAACFHVLAVLPAVHVTRVTGEAAHFLRR